MKQAKTTYAKVAPCAVRTAGLFCKASSSEPGRALDVSREIEGLLYRFTAPMQLTERELEMLLALTAIGCSQDGTFYTTRQFSGPDATTRARKQLEAKVEIRTSCSTLARELCRSTGGDSWTHISQALARLFAVSVFVKPASVVNWHRYSAGHLLDALTADMTGDTIAVSLSPVLASAVLEAGASLFASQWKRYVSCKLTGPALRGCFTFICTGSQRVRHAASQRAG